MVKKKVINKKVKNAQPLVYDGIKFKSKLEVYTYKKLKEEDLGFEYEKNKWTIVEKFEYMDEKVRAITIKPDFVNTNKKIIIEVKGWPTDIYKLRLKLFKKYLKVGMCEHLIYHVKNQTEVDRVIKELKNNQDEKKA